MTILIDGYNVLFAFRVVSRTARRALEQARGELLAFLVQQLTPSEVAQTILVFDSKHSPLRSEPADRQDYRGLDVRFARDHHEADELLEELIRQESVPEKLLVVSTDRRVQQAARRRRAAFVDSDTWLGQLEQRRSMVSPKPGSDPEPGSAAEVDTADGAAPLTPAETEKWLRELDLDGR